MKLKLKLILAEKGNERAYFTSKTEAAQYIGTSKQNLNQGMKYRKKTGELSGCKGWTITEVEKEVNVE